MSMFSTAAARQTQWMRLLADRCGLGAGRSSSRASLTAKDAKLGLCTIELQSESNRPIDRSG
ncbi:hypothetical protein QUA02_09620 [Microcoleus sp. SVA1_A4]